MKVVQKLKSGDFITINMFGKEKKVEVFSTDSDKFNENGEYQDAGFALDDKELECLNWFLSNVNIADYRKEITEYCNEEYDMIGDIQIDEADLENEIDIFAIAINSYGLPQSKDGFVYPEISFYGDCECDPEHGICIGFRDKKFLGIHSQDWTL